MDESDEYRFNLILSNLTNLLAEIKEVEIELVANAQGIKLLQKDNAYEERIVQLQNKGVTLVACNKTLQSLQLKPEDLLEGVKVVPSGVGELVKKQKEGWIYIRP
ncbi:MAG: DsrE family protein [Methanobacteriaceae archaeon]